MRARATQILMIVDLRVVDINLVFMALCLLVFHIVGSISEGLVAGLTFVRFFSGVNSEVSLQTERIRKQLITDVTLMLLLVWVLATLIALIGSAPVPLCLSVSCGSRGGGCGR